MLGFIRRTLYGGKNLLPTFRSLYTALVRSHLEYASEIWNPKSFYLVKLMEGVQRRATRLLLPELYYPMRLELLKLLPLVYRREIKDLSTSYKMKCVLYNCDFESYISFCSDKRLRSFSGMADTSSTDISSTDISSRTFRRRTFRRRTFRRTDISSNGLWV